MARTNKQIVDQTERLARELYALMGYQLPKNYKKLMHESKHPTERLMFAMAAHCQLELTDTDVFEILCEYDEEDE